MVVLEATAKASSAAEEVKKSFALAEIPQWRGAPQSYPISDGSRRKFSDSCIPQVAISLIEKRINDTFTFKSLVINDCFCVIYDLS